MKLILTMAGKYNRFRANGWTIPKYLLPYGEGTILSKLLFHLIKSMVEKEDIVFSIDNVFLVANKEDELWFGHVRKIMQSALVPTENLISISDTSGQAETAYLGLKEIMEQDKSDDCVLFHNVDTILYDRDIPYIGLQLAKGGGYVDTFHSNNKDYSYVMVENNMVRVISEKIVTTDIATSGLYGFASPLLFLNNYDKNDIFVSDIYKRMLQRNIPIIAGPPYTEKNTIVLGTPEQYLKASAEL